MSRSEALKRYLLGFMLNNYYIEHGYEDEVFLINKRGFLWGVKL